MKAKLQYLHMAPRKVRAVAAMVRGMKVVEAEWRLESLAKRAAEPLRKLVRSAVANATREGQEGRETLYIKEIMVNPGPVLKRTRPRAFGRSAMIRKRMSHITLVLGDEKEDSSNT
jgi:large subunit ribosomal protein L22